MISLLSLAIHININEFINKQVFMILNLIILINCVVIFIFILKITKALSIFCSIEFLSLHSFELKKFQSQLITLCRNIN